MTHFASILMAQQNKYKQKRCCNILHPKNNRSKLEHIIILFDDHLDFVTGQGHVLVGNFPIKRKSDAIVIQGHTPDTTLDTVSF